MNKLSSQQEGITFLSIVFILGIIAIFVLFALRAFPLYNEKFQIVSAMQTVVNRTDATKLKNKSAGKAFLRAIAVTNITRFNDTNVKEYLKVEKPKKKGDPKILHLKFEASNVLFSDLSLTLKFDKKMELTGSGKGD